MTLVDFVVIGLYFILVFGIGLYCSRGGTAEGYFLAGRSVGWVAVGASLFATNISSEHFIGLAGAGATTGLAVGHFEWLAVFMLMILAWVFVPFYLRSAVVTMPEFLERRYGPLCSLYLTSVSILAYIFTKISVSLYAGSLVLREVAGWNFYTSSMVLIVATGLYTIVGGLAAVIYTELVQAVILVAGSLTLMLIGLQQVGGFTGLRAALPADFFHMIKPASDPDFPWTGIFFGAPILGIWYWCTDQVIVQRVLGAKNETQARAGSLFGALLKVLPVFLLVLPGLIARALYPDVRGDQAYPVLVMHLLPAGLVGIVIAALLAALMSSLAATFNSSSTLVTFDFYRKLRPQASERRLLLVGRAVTVVMVALGLLWVPFISRLNSQVFIYLQSVQAYISPPIAAVFLFGVFWPRANRQGAFAALISGAFLGILRFVLEIFPERVSAAGSTLLSRLVAIHFLHFAILIFVISAAILILVSVMTPAESERKLRGLTFATLEGGLSGGKDKASVRILRLHMIASLALALLVTALWFHFA